VTENKSGVGERLRELRRKRHLTLAQVGKLSGYSASALSKMENEHLGISYDKLAKLAIAFKVDISSFFTDQAEPTGQQAAGRRSVARKGSGKAVATPLYDHLYVSPELSGKQMVPVLVKIRATSLEEFGPLIRHGGEEWIYVLRGEIELHSEFYEPERLGVGDSVYLDSRMGHAYISRNKGGADIVAVCSAPAAELVEHSEAKAKLSDSKAPRVRRRPRKSR
jgi:transcriptional regulator with XRE-family HTH domain